MNIPSTIPEDIYKKIVEKIQKTAEEKPADIVQCFDSVINRLPTPNEIEAILIYLNKDNIPQA
jgi:hypothetical protein|tara:strand:+ start:611 stop:799 length:189 start_codon:yes stop_codon:yes gene_type:complete